MNMLNTLPINGMVKAGQLLIHLTDPIRPNQVTVRKFGIIVTIAGIIIVLSRIPKIRSLPGKFDTGKTISSQDTDADATYQRNSCDPDAIPEILGEITPSPGFTIVLKMDLGWEKGTAQCFSNGF